MNDATEKAVSEAGTNAASNGGMEPTRDYLLARHVKTSLALMAVVKAIEECGRLGVIDTSPLVEVMRRVRNEHEYVLLTLYPKGPK